MPKVGKWISSAQSHLYCFRSYIVVHVTAGCISATFLHPADRKQDKFIAMLLSDLTSAACKSFLCGIIKVIHKA